jgi:hemerythrin-like domain-containing protein
MSSPMTTPSVVPQIRLPRQTAAADGPIDMIGMYLMHFAIRRDLDHFVEAVKVTPLDDRQTWPRLARRWEVFARTLHDHHTLEDAELWPRLEAAAHAASHGEALAVVAAMESEHAEIDPLLAAVSSGFERLSAVADHDIKGALEVRLSAGRERLLHHMQHEETEALPLVQRLLTAEDWDAMEAAAKKSPRDLPFFVPWVLHEMPNHAIPRIREFGGPVLFAVWRLFRGRFDRQERRAFRYL